MFIVSLKGKFEWNCVLITSHIGYTSPPPHHQRCSFNDEKVMYSLFVPLVVPGVVTDPTGNEAGGHPRTSAHVLWGSIYAVSSLLSSPFKRRPILFVGLSKTLVDGG